MQIPQVTLPPKFMAEVKAIVGPNGFSCTTPDRLSYCRDANFRSAIQAHYSKFDNFPAIIVWPETNEQISQLIKSAGKNKIALTPYGGGSGVCGGAINYQGGMILDLKKMNRILRLDGDRLFVDVESGMFGQNLENELSRQGYTLGHFPSSIYSATIGGYLAARSAGQHSSKYGKIEDMVIDLEFIDGQGKVYQTSDVSRSKGLDLTQIIVGSEGTLGVITKSRLKIFPKPKTRIYKSYNFSKVEYGMEALRRIMQTGIKPDVLRLYDELDSLLMFKKEGTGNDDVDVMPEFVKNAAAKIKSKMLKLVFKGPLVINELSRLSWAGCLLVVMLEGEPNIIEQQLSIINSICIDMNAKDLGQGLSRHWHKHRYSVSYKASKLFTDGAFTDTMEVATTWDNLERLYNGVISRLKKHCLVLAHISHVYNEGAAIYFTMVSPLTGLKSSLKKYDAMWQISMKAAQDFDGVLSHHHGIGRLKKQFIREEWGHARAVFDQLKAYFDPNNILNPEVLAPDVSA
jgi:alkyldihydroxyacetonephosphate synthase